MDTKIERYETIIVESVKQNQYGDLVVNGTLKVGKKRASLFNVFQVGAEVNLGYASYMNKEYIASAEQTGVHKVPDSKLVAAAKELGAVPVDEIRADGFKPQPTSQAPQSKSTPVIPSGQETGMTTKEIGDMIRANKLSVIFTEEVAKKLIEWYKRRIQNTTGIS